MQLIDQEDKDCIEREFKMLLTPKDFELIRKVLPWEKEYRQINIYFDTPCCLLHKRGITCRVRSVSGIHLLQIKYPILSDDRMYVSRRELEYQVEEIPPEVRISELLTDFDTSLVAQPLGSLTTYRKECLASPGITVFLDQNEYGEQRDFEIEVEFTGDEKEVLLFLQKHAITITKKSKGKYSRFLDTYRKEV